MNRVHFLLNIDATNCKVIRFVVDDVEDRNKKPVLNTTNVFAQNNEPVAKKASETAAKV
jgi:hypothetical protein